MSRYEEGGFQDRCVKSFKLHLYDKSPQWKVDKGPVEVLGDFMKVTKRGRSSRVFQSKFQSF